MVFAARAWRWRTSLYGTKVPWPESLNANTMCLGLFHAAAQVAWRSAAAYQGAGARRIAP